MNEDNQPMGQHEHEAHFVELIDTQYSRDIGISEFDEKLIDSELLLTEKYRGKEITNHDELQEIQQTLTQEWTLTGSKALISGRVYLIEPTFEGEFPAEWGDLRKDSDNREYYFLDNVLLRSQGTQISVLSDDNDKASIVKVGYSFSVSEQSDDEDETDDDVPVFIAYPGELSQHHYEKPTPAEVELRLTRMWPEQYKMLGHLIKPDLQMALPRRIALITDRMQIQLTESEEFCTLVELYIQDRLALHQQYPYIVTTDESILCYEGPDDPYGNNPEGSWTRVILQSPLSVLLYEAQVRVFMDKDGIVSLSLLGQIFNTHNKDQPEYVRFDVDSIGQFQSTLAQRAILDRVLSIVSSSDLTENPFSKVVSQLDAPVIHADLAPDNADVSNIADEVRDMMMLERELDRVKDIILSAQNILYSTQEEALAASKKLVSGKLSDMLFGAGILQGYQFKFSGSSVLLPKTIDENDLNIKPDVFTYGIDPDEKLYRLEDGDFIEGTIQTMVPSSDEIFDDEGQTSGFKVSPSIIVHVSTHTKGFIRINGLNLAEVNVVTRAIVPLNGTADIKIKDLEMHRTIGETLKKATEAYGPHQIVDRLQKFKNELENEDSKVFVTLQDVNLIPELALDVQNLQVQGMHSAEGVEVLDALLVGRDVELVGESFKLDGTPVQYSVESYIVRGNIVDVNNDTSRQGLNFVVMIDSDNIVYVPFSTVKDFKF